MSYNDLLRKTINDIVASLLVKREYALLGILLRRTTIISTCNNVDIAATDGLFIYICPQIFLQLPKHDQVFVLLHELLHILMLHPLRIARLRLRYLLPLDIYNAVMDAKANQELEGLRYHVSLQYIWPEDIEEKFAIRKIREKSVEEIIDEIIKHNGGRGMPQPAHPDLLERPLGGEVIQEGDEKPGEGRPPSPEEIEDRVKRKAAEALMAMKLAGRDPGHWERLINELLKPKVDWRRLLRAALARGLGPRVRKTWHRPSRRAPGLPGTLFEGYGKVVVMVDASGSIPDKELAQFLGEIHAVARESYRVHIIVWDARVQQEFVYSDIKQIKLRGGGGTMIAPALEYAIKKHPDAQLYIIFSDWEIYDLDDEKTRDLLNKIARRTIAVTSAKRPPHDVQFLDVIPILP